MAGAAAGRSSPGLTLGTKVSSTTAHNDTLDGGTAAQALFSSAVGYAKFDVCLSNGAIGSKVILHTGTLFLDALPYYLAKGEPELVRFFHRESPSSAKGMDSGEKKSFIGVHISDASYDFLVAKESLYRRATVSQKFSQKVAVEP